MDQFPGRRILIVEDNGLIALEIETMVRDSGAEVAGPVGSVREALSLVGNGKLDCAILDVNLGGEDVFPVADALSQAGIPFLFLTGHSDSKVPPRYHGCAILQKPFLPSRLLKALSSMVAEGSTPAA